VEPGAVHVPQPEPEAEAGAAAGPTRGTRQKPQPKAAGKTSKDSEAPSPHHQRCQYASHPRITKTGEPL
jgi:hypothetical protein